MIKIAHEIDFPQPHLVPIQMLNLLTHYHIHDRDKVGVSDFSFNYWYILEMGPLYWRNVGDISQPPT